VHELVTIDTNFIYARFNYETICPLTINTRPSYAFVSEIKLNVYVTIRTKNILDRTGAIFESKWLHT